jgi:iron complex outermembrane receptor protein
MNFYTNGTRIYSNQVAASLFSTDLQFHYRPVKNFSVFMLSKFTVGELNSGDPMPLVPPLKNIVSAKYQKGKFSVQLENETSMAQNRINKNYGEYRTPAYTLFNIKGGYTFPFSKTALDVGWGITNLFDKTYYEHLDWGRINRPGRNVDLFLKYSF